MEEEVHRREHIGVIARSRHDERAEAEGVGHRVVDAAARQVVEHHLRCPLLAENFRHAACCLLRAAVNAGKGHHHARRFHLVARPDAVQAQSLGQFLALQHTAVERTDEAHVEFLHLVQRLAHLRAIFAADVHIVAAGLRRPVVGVRIVGAEFAERIGREHCAVAVVVGHDHFRPVHQRRRDEVQRATAQRERAAVFHREGAAAQVQPLVELHHEVQRLGARHHLQRGVFAQRVDDGARVVGFHVLHHQVVGRATAQGRAQVLFPLFCTACVDGVHDAHLLVENHITVVAHALRHGILAFEEIEIAIVGSDVTDGRGNVGIHVRSVEELLLLLGSSVGRASVQCARRAGFQRYRPLSGRAERGLTRFRPPRANSCAGCPLFALS